MPLEPTFGPLGAVIEEEYTLETDAVLAQAYGYPATFGDNEETASFTGRWELLKSKGVTGVFLWERYNRTGRTLVPHFQKFGWCVAAGTETAIAHSYYNALQTGVQVGNPKEIAWEPMYGGSRVYVGKGRLTGEGSVGAWAAQWVAGVNGVGGICERGVYGSADLTRNNEPWARANADRGDRFPPELLRELQQHTCRAHRTRNNTEIADAIASKFGVARCWNTLFGNRDNNGMAKAASRGAHCQAIIGVFVMLDGSTGFVEINSWGQNNPRGPRTLRYAGGTIELPHGCYGVSEHEYRKAQSDRFWEAWAFSVRHGQEFR